MTRDRGDVTDGGKEIVPSESEARQSAITSRSIGVDSLATLLQVVPTDAPTNAYADAVLAENVLGMERAQTHKQPGVDRGRFRR